MTAADFNSDGNVDLITGTLGLLILLGKGDGTFTAQPVFQAKATAGNALIVGSADFNGDGKLDLFAVQDGGYIWMTLGNGDGTFVQTPITIGTGSMNLRWLGISISIINPTLRSVIASISSIDAAPPAAAWLRF